VIGGGINIGLAGKLKLKLNVERLSQNAQFLDNRLLCNSKSKTRRKDRVSEALIDSPMRAVAVKAVDEILVLVVDAVVDAAISPVVMV
jgi:hypothetical protein